MNWIWQSLIVSFGLILLYCVRYTYLFITEVEVFYFCLNNINSFVGTELDNKPLIPEDLEGTLDVEI